MIPLYSSHTNDKAVVHRGASELQGALLPRSPPGLCPGPTGGLTATPRPPEPQLSLATASRLGIFPFFILGLGFWIISMLGTGIRAPPPSGPSIYPGPLGENFCFVEKQPTFHVKPSNLNLNLVTGENI